MMNIISIVAILMGVGILIFAVYDVFSTPPESRDMARKLNSTPIFYGISLLIFGVLVLALSLSAYKKCPQCSEKYRITDELSYCEHCGYDLADYEYECSNCGEVYAELDGRNYCGKCGKSITE